MEQERFVTWEEIKSPASAWLFDVMGNGADIRWGRMVWRSLERRGFTSYADEEGRHHVFLRLYALSVMCREFCFLAWGAGERPEISAWADEMRLDPLEICAIAGGDYIRRVEEGDEDGDIAYEEALRMGVEQERGELFREMVDMFGGKMLLFAAMWKMSGEGAETALDGAGEPRDWDKWTNEELAKSEAALRHVIDGIERRTGEGKNEALEWIDAGTHSIWW